jgi:hypothetical protein
MQARFPLSLRNTRARIDVIPIQIVLLCDGPRPCHVEHWGKFWTEFHFNAKALIMMLSKEVEIVILSQHLCEFQAVEHES